MKINYTMKNQFVEFVTKSIKAILKHTLLFEVFFKVILKPCLVS